MDYLTKQFLISRAQSPEGPQLLPGASASFLIKFIYTRKGCERYFRQPQPDRMLSHSSKKAVRVEGEKKVFLTSLTCRKSFASKEMAIPGTGTSSSWAALYLTLVRTANATGFV